MNNKIVFLSSRGNIRTFIYELNSLTSGDLVGNKDNLNLSRRNTKWEYDGRLELKWKMIVLLHT